MPPIREYLRADFSFSAFRPRTRVIDLGCGQGWHLAELCNNGCDAVGVEPNRTDADECRRKGFEVIQGRAECLPLANASVGGVVCCIVLPYTDERVTVAEWARVLVPGGEVRASYIGLGYALRYTCVGPSWRMRLYGLRTICNTWFYRLTGRRLPGALGDTLYQSESRMRNYYRQVGLELIDSAYGNNFLGLPVLIYHHLRRR
jgi:SAM-dependent methyltransferase